MKQYPSKLKFKKNHKITFSNFTIPETKKFFPLYGNYFLKASESGKLNFKQIEACRKAIRRTLRKEGKLSLRLFTYSSVTKKALGSRMGKGKGVHSVWICPIRSGQVLFEISGISFYTAIKALKNAGTKLPLKSIISRILY